MKIPTSIALAILCLLQLVCLVRAPQVHAPAMISVALQPGQVQVLGQHELAAPQAAASHLALRRDLAGKWWARNISAGKAVLLQRDGMDRRMGSSGIERGQQLRIGAAAFEVLAAGARTVTLSGAGHTWRYDGATVLRDGHVQDACPGAGVAAWLGALWNRFAPHALTMARPLTFGGNLQCGNRIATPMLAGASAVLLRAPDGLLLSNAGGSEAYAPLLVDGAELARAEHRLEGVSALTVGRTRMAVSIVDHLLVLRPQRNLALFTEQEVTLPPGVSWQWQARSAWALAAGGVWWVALALAACSAIFGASAWHAGRWPFARADSVHAPIAAAGAVLLVIGGIGAVMVQRSGAPFGIGWSMLLAWAALWVFLLAPGRAALASCAGVLLLAAGLLMQLELGLGAMESSWLRHFQKTGALLAVGLGIGTLVRLRLRASPIDLPQLRLEWLLAALAGCALLGLAMQVLFGDETGVFDVQPVEFAKLALTALTAHCIAIGLGWQRGLPHTSSAALRWMRLGAPALLFTALLGLALLQVDDFSPLILLLVWAMVMALAWSVAARQPFASAALAALALTAVGAIVWLRLAGADQLGQWGFYADRFAVWLDPAAHPHTGQQLLLGARAIAQGAWWGADNWLGLAALGDAAGSALGIPAVQDDFAPTFFIHRHGLLGALALWALQALFLVGLLQTAGGAFVAGERARDFRQAWRWRLRCFVLCGGAAFVLGHLLLSWGTNLAIFPIMGQPMSFLSAGGSHLLFFICPLLAFNAISAQSLEENASCRSMSNTKSWAR